MNEDIKKLLNDIKKCDSLHNNCDYLLEHSDCDLLIEYIGQLEIEWKELNNFIENKLKDKICDELYYEAFIEIKDKMQELENK